jgi:hypothetical protein
MTRDQSCEVESLCVLQSVGQVEHGVLCIVIQQLDELKEDRTGLINRVRVHLFHRVRYTFITEFITP